MSDSADDLIGSWLTALDQRHLASLTSSEVARALRALSSCYVERRGQLATGGALESAGKRAAFALFYAPLHFFVTRAIVRSIAGAAGDLREIVDVGCGTGSAGAAWSLESGTRIILGFDRHPWAVAEANWTYKQLGLHGRAAQRDAGRIRLRGRRGTAVLGAYSINELADSARDALLNEMVAAHARGSRLLVIEPIARRTTPWWASWRDAFIGAGGRVDDWRFPADLPARQRQLARAAGLEPRELTARSLYLASGSHNLTPLGVDLQRLPSRDRDLDPRRSAGVP